MRRDREKNAVLFYLRSIRRVPASEVLRNLERHQSGEFSRETGEELVDERR